MPRDTSHAANPAVIRTRLERLRELIALHANSAWGRSYVREILYQEPDAADLHCPRFAGLIGESGQGAIVVGVGLRLERWRRLGVGLRLERWRRLGVAAPLHPSAEL
jgi:hypothetical protein